MRDEKSNTSITSDIEESLTQDETNSTRGDISKSYRMKRYTCVVGKDCDLHITYDVNIITN